MWSICPLSSPVEIAIVQYWSKACGLGIKHKFFVFRGRFLLCIRSYILGAPRV